VTGEWFLKMANTPKDLNIRVKTKPALPENDPGETG
jgi:hypothetical protein